MFVLRIFSVFEGSLTKVVHHKYTYKDGKRYGPYLYETKRVDGRVVTSYLGSSQHKFNRKIAYAFLFALLLGVFAFFVSSSLHSFSSTGRVAFDVNVVYKEGEPLDGDLRFRIKEGELVPKDAQLFIDYANQTKVIPLADLVLDSPISGEYYAEGTSLSGEGEGYGIKGAKISYPKVIFKMFVSSADGSQQQTSNETSSSDSSALVVPATTETPPEGSAVVNGIDSSGNDEGGSSGGGNQANSGGSKSSSDSVSSPVSGESVGSITAAAVSDPGFEVDGSTSHDQAFSYTLSEGQHARIIADSVSVDGVAVPDSSVSLNVNGDEVTVNTDYFTSKDGFGEEFLGDYALTLQVDINKLGLYAVPGDLGLRLVAGNVTVASYKQNVEVAKVDIQNVTNITLPTIVQIAPIPLQRIAPGATLALDMKDYFSGATSYEAVIDNMTVDVKDSVVSIKPELGYKGSRRATITAIAGDEKLVSNEFTILVSSGAVRITTTRDKIVVGEPVRWEKKVTLDGAESINVEVPQDAQNLSVKRRAGDGYVEVNQSISNGGGTITGGALTGNVAIEVDLSNNKKRSNSDPLSIFKVQLKL